MWKSLALWAAAWSSGEFVRASYQLKSRTIPTLPFWAAYILKNYATLPPAILNPTNY
jgi:hypothetical protein